jgi:WD40 repeat protein
MLRRQSLFTGHQAAIYALAAGQTSRQFISAGGDGWITQWSLDQPDLGHLVARVEGQVFSLANGPDDILLAGDMQGALYWIERSEEATAPIGRQAHQKGIFSIQYIDNHVFTAGGDGTLTRWDAQTQRATDSYQLSNVALRTITPPYREGDGVSSPIGGGREGVIGVGSSDGAIYLLRADTLELVHVIRSAHQSSVFSLVWSPDGRYLLSGGRDAMLNIWDVYDNYALVSSQAAHLFTINDIVFSPDGQYFATASRGKTIRIWEAATFQLIKALDTVRDNGHLNSVNRLLWLPDALLSCSDDRTIMAWAS